MRIAVSGTHGSGKSTLVADFLAAHPEYVHEPEPYEWMEDVYGEAMGEEPAAEDFHRQLELSVERLRGYGPGAKMIAERSPLDFVAYLLALRDLRRGGAPRTIASAGELAAEGLACVDLLVVLPLEPRVAAPAGEDLELREAMNDRLLDLIPDRPRAVEIGGSREQRLRRLEEALGPT